MIEILIIFALAFLFDMIIGDPHYRLHPIVLLGNYSKKTENLSRKLLGDGFISGFICSLFIIISLLLLISIFTWLCFLANYYIGIFFSSIILYFTIAPHSMISHSNNIQKALREENINDARRNLSMIVSRDTGNMDEKNIIRSCIESLGENIIDAVTSPIFFAGLGYLFAGPIGLVVGAVLLRIVNTLDAMFGYKNEKYINFGTFPAKFDDVLHYIPARVTVLAVYVASFSGKMYPGNSIKYALRDHKEHPSPNSAWGMAAFAGALGIKLGGPTKYSTGIKNYPYWGESLEDINIDHIKKANKLVALTTFNFSLFILLFVWVII